MNIRQKLGKCLLGIGLLGLSASTALASGAVVVGRPYGYGYGYPGFYPPPYAGYVPVGGPAYGYPVGGYYSPNPALQNPGSPSNPAVLNYYMNGAPIPPGAVRPDPRFYDGGQDFYLY
ncbi:MAG TPA: hypothetical protein VJR29_01665 [bacterium]|nr:hypothetical protein [bacterium]